VEGAGRWKPHPAAYRYAADYCGVDPAKVVLVAVHPWDIEGAHRAGLATAYLDRTGAPWPPIFATPTHRIEKLSDLTGALA
jgi:2-haloacid dehalogenase